MTTTLIAILNYNNCLLLRDTHEAFTKKGEKASLLMMHEFVQMRLNLRSGGSFSPDEIIQSMVDGAQVSIKFILSNAKGIEGKTEYSKINWDSLLLDLNLGVLYSHLEALWDDCLWNEFQASVQDDLTIFSPENNTWESRLVASQFRNENINMNRSSLGTTYLMKFGQNKLKEIIGIRNIKSIHKDGRKQIISFDKDISNDLSIQLFAARLYASEPYYSELLNESQDNLFGASLNDLLKAWATISNLAILMRNNLVKDDSSPKSITLPSYAPIIQSDVLERAISSELSINLNQASAIVRFLTFEAKTEQELWAQPLIQVSSRALSPLFSAAISPNLRRLIDIWLKQLDVDMSRRGPAFESHINRFIEHSTRSSNHLDSARVLLDGMIFRPSADSVEQIDTVFSIGNLVIIGESKCIRQPTESKEFAFYRKTVIDAAHQIKRKANSAEKNRDAFHYALSSHGLQVRPDFKILPIVVLSSSIYAGFEVDGVPITDEYILNVFFDGEFKELALRHANGDIEDVKKTILYSSFEEAAIAAPEYFRSPPQMKALCAGIKPRWIPIPRISEKDWNGIYLTFECTPDLESTTKDFASKLNSI